MSESDSFIREVTEEVRRDRLQGLWRRFGPVVVGGLVAIVAVSAALQWWSSREEGMAREAGARLLDALERPEPGPRADALMLERDALDDDPGRLALLAAAASYSEAGDAAAAADAYDALAADADASDAVAGFAAYRAAMLRAPEVGANETVGALSPLAEGEGPFRLLALEGRAAALAAAGDAAGARADIEAALASPVATDGLRQRVEALLASLPPAAQ